MSRKKNQKYEEMRQNELETAETTDHINTPIEFQMLEFSDTDCEILCFITRNAINCKRQYYFMFY